RRQALRQGIYDETQAAQERYDEAQRNYRQRQREAAERARREAEERANRLYNAQLAAARAAAARGGGGGDGPAGGGGQVGGVNVTPTSTQRSPSLSGAEQMFRAENPTLFTAGRLIQPVVPQSLQNMAKQA